MPLYDYKCRNCDNHFRKLLKIAEMEEPIKEACEECGGEIYHSLQAPNIISGVSTKDKRPEWFKDRLRYIKKNAGKDNTMGNVI